MMKSTLSLTLLLILLGLLAGCATTSPMEGETRRSTATIIDDQLIESKALDRLYGDQQLERQIHINVVSYNRIVLLTGEALSRQARSRAVDIVRHLDKVRRVHNEIRIKDLTDLKSRARDGWITSQVKARMLATRDFPTTRVKVITEDSTVSSWAW